MADFKGGFSQASGTLPGTATLPAMLAIVPLDCRNVPVVGLRYSNPASGDLTGRYWSDGSIVASGEYRVSVTKREKLDIDFGPSPEDPAEYAKWEQKLKDQPVPKHLIPEKYSSFGSSDLSITIAEGTPAEETLELTD